MVKMAFFKNDMFQSLPFFYLKKQIITEKEETHDKET